MRKILIVEDEETILLMLKEILTAQNYEVVTASDGNEGFAKFRSEEFDLIISDIMMPNSDGYELAEKVRQINTNIPIVFLTAISEEHDQIRAFDLGIDDFITKPFSIAILEKRLESLLRRNKVHKTFEFDDISIDFDAHTLTSAAGNIVLTNKEFAILTFLVQNKTKVVSRESISDAVWGPGYYGDLRNIDTHIKNIRRKLKTDKILTVKGVGYNLVA